MTSIARTLSLCAAVSCIMALSLQPAFAADSGGGGNTNNSDNGNGGSASPKKLKCKRNEMVKLVKEGGKEVKKCVKRTSGLISDEELFDQGRALAKEGEYDWALDILALIGNQNDPKVLNYMGYSHRKAGRLETGIAFYRKALEINPDFIQAREYLGEGYVAAGRVDLAKLELDEIEKRCGASCPEYGDLAKAIASASN